MVSLEKSWARPPTPQATWVHQIHAAWGVGGSTTMVMVFVRSLCCVFRFLSSYVDSTREILSLYRGVQYSLYWKKSSQKWPFTPKIVREFRQRVKHLCTLHFQKAWKFLIGAQQITRRHDWNTNKSQLITARHVENSFPFRRKRRRNWDTIFFCWGGRIFQITLKLHRNHDLNTVRGWIFRWETLSTTPRS